MLFPLSASARLLIFPLAVAASLPNVELVTFWTACIHPVQCFWLSTSSLFALSAIVPRYVPALAPPDRELIIVTAFSLPSASTRACHISGY